MAFNISYTADLLAMNSFNLCASFEKVFILPSFCQVLLLGVEF